MNFGISDKDQTQVKEAFSSLWEVCGNTWDKIFDDTSEEKIKELSEYSKRKEEISVDLKKEKIIFGNSEIKFEIDPFKKKCLLEGLDDIALSLEKSEKIASFETELKSKKPWIFND